MSFVAPSRWKTLPLPSLSRSSLCGLEQFTKLPVAVSTMGHSRVHRSSSKAKAPSPSPKVSRDLTKTPALPRALATNAATQYVYQWPGPLVRCKLIKRYKRFLTDIVVPGVELPVTAHCPNPGSMKGLELDSCPEVLVSRAPPASSSRKLDYTLEGIFVDSKDTVVGCNTSLPNTIVENWLLRSSKAVKDAFGDFISVRREVVYGKSGRSRIDFLLEYAAADEKPYFVEVKNVTMTWDDEQTRVAVFPDSKTVRGQKHLEELMDVVEQGKGRACMLFFVNRPDCASFAPCTIDPKYVALFELAEKAGVKVLPLVFQLCYDDNMVAAGYKFVGKLPVHERSGP